MVSKRGILKRHVDKRKMMQTKTLGGTISDVTSNDEDLEALVQGAKKTKLKRRATQIPANIPGLEFTQSSIR